MTGDVNVGTKIYNKIIEKHIVLEQYNIIKFKKLIKRLFIIHMSTMIMGG